MKQITVTADFSELVRFLDGTPITAEKDTTGKMTVKTKRGTFGIFKDDTILIYDDGKSMLQKPRYTGAQLIRLYY